MRYRIFSYIFYIHYSSYIIYTLLFIYMIFKLFSAVTYVFWRQYLYTLKLVTLVFAVIEESKESFFFCFCCCLLGHICGCLGAALALCSGFSPGGSWVNLCFKRLSPDLLYTRHVLSLLNYISCIVIDFYILTLYNATLL